ncbi:hypothetical protein WME76_35385 [Sorangium sp. So ce119]|uniref:PD-(D/E)XK nuclease domain-containing protein n=1 Tax=Sorangium sp. So ce119 TaxID=3133279 RepID=UPI003F5F862D
MYNLLVTNNSDAWKRSPYNNLHRDRFLEHTESSIKDLFKDLTPAAAGILCSFPALFMYEEQRSQPGWRGRIAAIRADPYYLSISFEVDRGHPITWNDINDFTESLGITDHAERDRTHWAVKDIDLDQVLARLPAGVGSVLSAASLPRAGESLLLEQVRQICSNFREVVTPLIRRRAAKTPFSIADEYDVQDLLHMALRALTLEVRVEEPGASFAGAGSLRDFFVPKARTVIEVKRVRDSNHGRRGVADELMADRVRHANHGGCERLVCLVFDPEGHISNPVVFKQDLESGPGVPLEVYVAR